MKSHKSQRGLSPAKVNRVYSRGLTTDSGFFSNFIFCANEHKQQMVKAVWALVLFLVSEYLQVYNGTLSHFFVFVSDRCCYASGLKICIWLVFAAGEECPRGFKVDWDSAEDVATDLSLPLGFVSGSVPWRLIAFTWHPAVNQALMRRLRRKPSSSSASLNSSSQHVNTLEVTPTVCRIHVVKK